MDVWDIDTSSKHHRALPMGKNAPIAINQITTDKLVLNEKLTKESSTNYKRKYNTYRHYDFV